MAIRMTIREALGHVWEPDGISQIRARELVRRGCWANGEQLDPVQEMPALWALAGGAGPDDEIDVASA